MTQLRQTNPRMTMTRRGDRECQEEHSADGEGDVDLDRRAMVILYISGALNVAVGFGLLVAFATTGDGLAASLGVVIMGGTIAAAVLVRAVLRVAARNSAVASSLDDLRTKLETIKRSIARSASEGRSAAEAPRVRTLDLSALGAGDPSRLTAAILDRDVFPRLVKTMEVAPPARSGERPDLAPTELGVTTDATGSAPDISDAGRRDDPAEADMPFEEGPATDVATNNLWRQWKVALRNEDLAGCRSVFSALVDTIGPPRIAPLRAEMEALADRSERRLRAAFSQRVRDRDYAAALAIGERICSLLPDRPITEDFKRIRPYLLRRIEDRTAQRTGRRTRAR